MCTTCKETNFSNRTACYGCSRARGACHINPNDWRCSKCDTINFKHRSACFKCHEPKGDARTETQLSSLEAELVEKAKELERIKADAEAALAIKAKEIETAKAEMSDDVLCKVCMTNPHNTVCRPCNHAFACTACVAAYADTLRTCSVCRTPSTGYERIYRA